MLLKVRMKLFSLWDWNLFSDLNGCYLDYGKVFLIVGLLVKDEKGVGFQVGQHFLIDVMHLSRRLFCGFDEWTHLSLKYLFINVICSWFINIDCVLFFLIFKQQNLTQL